MARHPLAGGRTVLVWWPSLALGGIEAKREALSPRSAREARFGIRGRGLVSPRLEEDVVYFCVVSIGWFQSLFFYLGEWRFRLHVPERIPINRRCASKWIPNQDTCCAFVRCHGSQTRWSSQDDVAM